MSTPTEFVQSLAQRTDLSHAVHVVAQKARIDMALGGVTFLLALFYLVHERTRAPPTNLDEVRARLWELRKRQLFSDMGGAAVVALLAYRVYRSYRPTNSELSTAILIRYLRLKGIVEDDLYEVLKGLKPYRIETLKL